jgi:hypothetical protein
MFNLSSLFLVRKVFFVVVGLAIFVYLMKCFEDERSRELNSNLNEKTFQFIPDQLVHYFLFCFQYHLLKVTTYQIHSSPYTNQPYSSNDSS